MTRISSVRLSVEVTCQVGSLRVVHANSVGGGSGLWAFEVGGYGVEMLDRCMVGIVRATEDGRTAVVFDRQARGGWSSSAEALVCGRSPREAEGVSLMMDFVLDRSRIRWWEVVVRGVKTETRREPMARVTCEEMARLAGIVRPWLPVGAPLEK